MDETVDGAASGALPEGAERPNEADLGPLLARKRRTGATISVCLPARDEEATVGSICATLREELLEPGLIDQIVVMDSRSRDGTAEAARREGAEVFSVTDVLPGIPATDGGKGEALWKSLAVARGDIVVWNDADTRNFTARFVSRLVEPLLAHPDLVMAKAFYERPLVYGDRMVEGGGARVTELLARPLLNLFYPELSAIVQPLSGEYAVRASTARSVPFLTGYAADIGLLIGFAEEFGIEAIAQVDLGTRIHRNQEISALGRMAHQVAQGMLTTFDRLGRVKLVEDLPTNFTQYTASVAGYSSDSIDLAVSELPPIATWVADAPRRV